MGENGSRLCESVGKMEKAAEEGRKRRGRIQLEPSRTRAFVLGLRSTPVIKSMFYSNDKADIIQADKAISSKDVPRNGATVHIEPASHGKSLVRKEVRWAMQIESRHRTAGCGRQLDEDQQKRRCASTGTLRQARSLKTNQQTKTTSRCKLWPEYGNGSMAWYMDGWREFQKALYQGEGNPGRHPQDFLRHMGSGLHAETGRRKVYAAKVFEWQQKSEPQKRPVPLNIYHQECCLSALQNSIPAVKNIWSCVCCHVYLHKWTIGS